MIDVRSALVAMVGVVGLCRAARRPDCGCGVPAWIPHQMMLTSGDDWGTVVACDGGRRGDAVRVPVDYQPTVADLDVLWTTSSEPVEHTG